LSVGVAIGLLPSRTQKYLTICYSNKNSSALVKNESIHPMVYRWRKTLCPTTMASVYLKSTEVIREYGHRKVWRFCIKPYGFDLCFSIYKFFSLLCVILHWEGSKIKIR